MRIFLFKSEGKRDLRAFTGDPGGQQLPSRFGPWHAVGVVKEEKALPFNVGRDVVEQAITSNGFQMFRMKPKKIAVAA
jgi:hypothetical protein